jgi:hypothetical protein
LGYQAYVDEAKLDCVWNEEAGEEAQNTCPPDSRYENLVMGSSMCEDNIYHLSEFVMMGTPVYWNYLPQLGR